MGYAGVNGVVMNDLERWIDQMGTYSSESDNHLLANYDIGEELGTGSECVVYKARRKDDNLPHAIRIPRMAIEKGWSPHAIDGATLGFDVNENVINDFKKELKIWIRAYEAVPDNVVKLIDFNISPFPWCVMELGE